MDRDGLINNLFVAMLGERGAYFQLSDTKESDQYRRHQIQIRQRLAEIREPGDVGLILQGEIALLNNEQEIYGNSGYMMGSLDKALNEAHAAQATYAEVLDPARYAVVDRLYQSHKSRSRGLPVDEARQFFKSHCARLINLDKARLDDLEKNVLDERRRNLRVGERAYKELQQKALGLDVEKGKERDRSL